MKGIVLLVAVGSVLTAQVTNPTSNAGTQGTRDGSQPVFSVTVVSRSTTSINYRVRSGETKVDFAGTALMPNGKGQAGVEGKRGVYEIDAKFERMQPASTFGPEYLTYVLWAISPEGRPTNMGEVLLDDGGRAKINTSAELQNFGMIVTAEPYYAVTQPSDVVVLENQVRRDTLGKFDVIDAKFELLPRGQYTKIGSYKPVALDKKQPLELYEARNAVQIARNYGADRYAADSFNKALQSLQQAEGYQARKGVGAKPVIMMAREAVQTAEDSRIIAVRRAQEERLAQERAAAAEREATAKRQAEDESQRRALADEQRRKAEEQTRVEEQRRAQAEQQTRVEEQRRAQAETERLAAERAKADAQAATLEAQQQRAAAERAKAEADAARQAALAQQQALAGEAEKARLAAAEADRLRQRAESDQATLRKQLLDQFNLILETRDTARGLVVNISDVLFDTGKYTLKPGAREKLARLAGIILSHPGLKLEIEGHTDSVGGDDYNQRLSEQRASGVKDYLTSQGMRSDAVTTRGFGKTQPVASNDTASGRQRNRRVEMIVSGEVIGTKLESMRTGTPTSTPTNQQ